MARLAIALAATFALLLPACGQDQEQPKSPPQTPTSSSPSSGQSTAGTPAGGPAAPAGQAQSWTGTLQPVGVSIHMEGTHKLVEGGKTVVLLKSTNPFAELAKFEGKRVKVGGMPSPTVEGGQTIVDVQTIVEAP